MKGTIPPEAATRALLAAAQQGDKQATDTLIRNSMPLVEAVVKKLERPDLYEDLLQAGLCGSSEGQNDGQPAKPGGLMLAIQRWDPDRGVKWSTFATWWIRAAVQAEACKLGPLIGPNRRALKRRAKVRAAAGKLERQLGREPTIEEVGAALKVPERPGILKAAMQPLPRPIRESPQESPGKRVWEELRSGNTPTPEQALDYSRQIERVRAAVMALPDVERVVIAGSFGINAREMPQAALAKVAGLSERGLREAKLRALARLKDVLQDLEVRVRDQDLEDPVAKGESAALGELDGMRSSEQAIRGVDMAHQGSSRRATGWEGLAPRMAGSTRSGKG